MVWKRAVAGIRDGEGGEYDDEEEPFDGEGTIGRGREGERIKRRRKLAARSNLVKCAGWMDRWFDGYGWIRRRPKMFY